MKKTAARGHTAKHSASSKHASSSKHSPKRKATSASAHKASVHTVAKPASHAKPVALALAPGDVACCAAEALAASLRLAGGSVSDSDVLALHWLAGGSADAGVPILAALEAASEFGLGGVRPHWHTEGRAIHTDSQSAVMARPGLILGVELPGPHAVTVGPDGAWWSWGEPYDPAEFPDAVVEEAWAITWR